MRLNQIIYAITTIFVLSSCDNSQRQCENVIVIDPKVKDSAIKLDANIIPQSYNFIYAKDFFVHNDTILIVVNKPYVDGYFVEFLNLKTDSVINRFITMGNGPGEMLNVLSHVREGKVIIHDFVKNQIGCIDIDSVLTNPNYKMRPLMTFNETGSPFVTILDDMEIILESPYCFKNEELGIDNKTPRFIKANWNSAQDISQHKFYTYNVSQGLIIPNISKNRIVYASSFLDFIELYDLDAKLIKKVEGPNLLKINYVVEDNSVSFAKFVPYSFMGFYSDQNYFYLSYLGNYFGIGHIQRMQDFNSWILKFDWDCNLIDCYSSEKCITSLSISRDKGAFYGKGYDNDGTVVLWKLSPIK